MTRAVATLLLALSLLVSPATVHAGKDARALTGVFGAIEAKDWDQAQALGQKAGTLAQDLVEWHRLRAGEGTWDDYRRFLEHNWDWPGLPLLRKRGESAIPDNAPPRAVISYFAPQSPRTGRGTLALAKAYLAVGERGDAEVEIVRTWRSMSLKSEERAAFLAAWGKLLKPHHLARLDMLLWRGLTDEARAMEPLVGKDWAALAEARIGLRKNAKGVDDLIKAIPVRLLNDPGLAYERFRWRFRKGRDLDAARLILERSATAATLGEPAKWANGRRQLARALMRAGNGKLAYRVASTHQLSEGSNFADLEWLSGYIALRYLKDPKRALAHFQAFRAAVRSPISLGRAGYWQGRAYEAEGLADKARAAYAFGARYQTSFYGQLAAERAGLPMDPALTGQEAFPDWRQAPFMTSHVLRAGLLLREAGQQRLATRFLVHLASELNPTELGQLADLAQAMGDPHSALMIAKNAARRGIVLPRAYYPLHPLAAEDLPISPELALSIARRESEFNPEVVSQVGARGLMQLMPRTAKRVSEDLGLKFDLDRLLKDWRYNAALGSAYLAGLQKEFGKSPLLVAAGYNAGPSRAREWMKVLGDPRGGRVDMVDWIEHIPFRETRNYVMRVAESLPVYRARLSGKPQPLHLLKELAAR